MRNSPIRVATLLLLATLHCVAQTAGSIGGIVVDRSGAVVPGARVELTTTDTGQSRVNIAGSDGHFVFPDLLPGRYQARVTAGGFSDLLLRDLILTVGQQMTLHPTLNVRSISEAIEVSGTPPPVATETSSVSHLVDSQRIDRLPLNGRNALQLVSLVPGVLNTADIGQFGATQVSFSVGGARAVEMNFNLDGGANLNTFYNEANEYPNPDALQEFAVSSRSYTAAAGRGLSQVTAVTKSGTNRFHGSLFEFLRNTDFDARPFFAANRSPFKRNQYGGTIGGPIRQNKLFFFFSYQGTKQRGSPGDTRYRTLTDAERQGDFSASKALRDPSKTMHHSQTTGFRPIAFCRSPRNSSPHFCRGRTPATFIVSPRATSSIRIKSSGKWTMPSPRKTISRSGTCSITCRSAAAGRSTRVGTRICRRAARTGI
jgi:hypothetical protein